MPFWIVSPSSTWTDSRRLAVGRNSRPQALTILLDRRLLDGVQLHPNQPLPRLPATLSLSLFGWLAREMQPGSHALRARFRRRSGRLLSGARRGGCAVSGMEALSGSEARVLAWRYLGS